MYLCKHACTVYTTLTHVYVCKKVSSQCSPFTGTLLFEIERRMLVWEQKEERKEKPQQSIPSSVARVHHPLVTEGMEWDT